MSILIKTRNEVEPEKELAIPSWWKCYSQYMFLSSETEVIVVHHINGFTNISISAPDPIFKYNYELEKITEAEFNNVMFRAYRKISDTCEKIMGLNSVAAEIYPLYEIAN